MTTSEEQTDPTPATATVNDDTPARKARTAKRRAHAAPPKPKPAHRAARSNKAVPARRGSKTAKILDLLQRPGGASLKELAKATGWKPNSVRGFLSGTVGKKMEISVQSSQRGDGQRAYRICSK